MISGAGRALLQKVLRSTKYGNELIDCIDEKEQSKVLNFLFRNANRLLPIFSNNGETITNSIPQKTVGRIKSVYRAERTETIDVTLYDQIIIKTAGVELTFINAVDGKELEIDCDVSSATLKGQYRSETDFVIYVNENVQMTYDGEDKLWRF